MSDLGIDLTKEQLNEIEERCNAATPGPWTWRKTRWDKVGPNILLTAPDMEVLDSVSQPHILKVDSEFIAHARIDLPLLLAMARQKIELEARVKELEDQREIARGIYPTLEKAEERIQELEAMLVKHRRKAAINADILHKEIRENEELEAQAAAMKLALERVTSIDSREATFADHEMYAQALSGEAGKALLEKLQSRTELIADLADSLRDFGGDQEERRSSRYRRAAEALDRADALAGEVKSAA